jgi:hypothetical protein
MAGRLNNLRLVRERGDSYLAEGCGCAERDAKHEEDEERDFHGVLCKSIGMNATSIPT